MTDDKDAVLEHAHSPEHVDLNRNVNARIQNPLAGISDTTLKSDVEVFCAAHGFNASEQELMIKGAYISKDPENFEKVAELREEEKEALRYEATHRWSHPLALYLTIITCSIGAAVQGWDQTGSNGANLSFPREFGIGEGENTASPDRDRDNWLVGLVNAAPFIGAALLGCWLSDPMNTFFGRRTTIFVSGIFCLVTPIGGAFTQTWEELFVTRLLLGIGMGLKGATVPVFAAENSPARIRGALVMCWQMWVAFGIFLGFIANLAVYKVGDIAWRLQIGSAFIPAVPLVLFIYFCPESPRWLMKNGRYREAYVSLKRLRKHELFAARDLYFIDAQLKLERIAVGKNSYVKRFFQLFTIPRNRRATLAAFTVMIGQQMCGINIIAFYSSTIFVKAGASSAEALIASFGFGLVNFVFAWPAIYTIDTFGRRSLLLFTFPNMAWSLLTAGLCFLIPSSSRAHLGLIATFIYVFAAFYSPGEGPVPFTYSAEVFPLSHRECGMAFAVATNLFWAAVLSMSFPKILDTFHPIGSFCFYAGLNLVAFVMIFLFVPETKLRTLEELDYIFAVPSSRFIRYQVTDTLPYWWRRGLRCDKTASLAPLYHLEKAAREDGGQRHEEEKLGASPHRAQRSDKKSTEAGGGMAAAVSAAS